MWDNIKTPWRAAFEQGWVALKNGSFPIGAVIADQSGEIISYGRNRVFESGAKNPKIAHAEIEAIQNLDIIKYPHVREYTLFTCMEPCPMCMGTAVMSNLHKLRAAARDSYCGAAHFCRDDPFIASKNIQVTFETGILETVQLVLQTYFELRRCGGKTNRITSIYEKDNLAAFKAAKSFYESGVLENFILGGAPFYDVFDNIANLLS